MQRCPYIHEMRERLLGENNRETLPLEQMERANLIDNRQSATSDSHQVGTVVKLHADGYHTSPAHQRTPLVPRDLGEDFNLDFDDDFPLDPRKPKNAKENQNHSMPDKNLDFKMEKLKLYSPNKKNRELYSCTKESSKGTSLFIVTSLVYAMILIVVCIAYVISDVTTHRLPVYYYEGFFTYLYGASILFLLYVFCFLLQESSCCNGGSKTKPPPKEKKEKKSKKSKKGEPVEAGKEGGGKGSFKESGKGGKPSPFQEKFPKKKRDLVREQYMLISQQDTQAEAEAAQVTPKNIRKRKTTHGDPTHGSFFLRVGAIVFGLGAMIYVGLEFGSFFEIPFTSPCHNILSGVNPLLQMIFTFMQMYFIFMNARLNIHRFKVVARFGLMHVVATNICVWIRTLVKESLYEITLYYRRREPTVEDSAFSESFRRHSLRHAGEVLKTHIGPNSEFEIISHDNSIPLQHIHRDDNILSKMVKSTVDGVANVFNNFETTTRRFNTPSTTHEPTTMINKIKKFITSTTTTSTTTTQAPMTTLSTSTTEEYITSPSNHNNVFASVFSSTFGNAAPEATAAAITTTTTEENSILNNLFSGLENSYQTMAELNHEELIPLEQYESLDNIYPAALSSNLGVINSTACGRIDIMGTIVYDSAPYLYPFVIEYSLIGAVVLYVMWKHIGRYPRYLNEEDLEHRLEVMLSRRAVAMAQQARTGRVDCVGSSKGLFFGLLLLVGALICLILFFVLVRHSKFSLLAIYLADASHCILMIFAILAIIIGFIRVKNLKFRCEGQSNLNDILLRISAFGLFVYSVFSVIAGSLKMLESEPNLLVMVTGIIAVLQVVLQILFIADVSRRRVHLPEHDRSKPGRQIVTFLLICNVAMFAVYTFEAQKVFSNPVQLEFYGFVPWSIIQRVTLPLCIFHRFHSAVTLAEIWKTTYKARLE